MRRFQILSALCMLLVFMAACQQDVLSPLPNSGTTPGPITNPVVQNLPGGAQITYALPNDSALLYVKAEYQFQGQTANVIASYYKKTLLIQGFADTLTHEVKLYAVSRGEKASVPVTVQIKPLLAPISDVRSSLVVTEGFGGFSVQLTNPSKGNVMIGVLRYDTIQKQWTQIDAYYTNLAQGTFSTRGLDSIPQRFGFFVKDRWNNLSDTLKLRLKPVYEVQLDGTKFVDKRKAYPIPQMAPLPASGLGMKEMSDYNSSYVFKNLFDGNLTSMFHTKQNYDQPTWLPIDLGKKYRLSRYRVWQRTGTFLFNHGNPHTWEIWGTNNPTDVNSWVKLSSQTMVKPSGLPLGVNSQDDVDAGNLGQEYMFPDNVPAVRYIAWKNIDSWGSIEGATGFFHLYELRFWGQVVQ